VVMHCYVAVQRWRWRRIEQHLPKLAASGSGRGPFMEPIWQLLKAKSGDKDWTAVQKGCLRSVMAGRQFPQSRVKACGWSTHDRCLTCLNEIVETEFDYANQPCGACRPPKTAKDTVVATP
jgi:hypothetical protein